MSSTSAVGLSLVLSGFAIAPPQPATEAPEQPATVEELECPPPAPPKPPRDGERALLGLGITAMITGVPTVVTAFVAGGYGIAGNLGYHRRLDAQFRLQRVEQYGPPDAYLPALTDYRERLRREQQLGRINRTMWLVTGGLFGVTVVLMTAGLVTQQVVVRRERPALSLGPSSGGLELRF